ncbi:hypothetical protein V5799_000853 [Amblyomma americanum]|uniref:Uncharacterized protein n=1 Tax=Amblyomma americanum TaxID=6943 RepID=A0AAQ4D1V6_AMBAM
MVHGTNSTSSRTATPASDAFEASTEISRPQNLDSSTSERNENTPPPQQPSPQQQQPLRKRKRATCATEFQEALLTEQRLLKESLEASHATEVVLRELQYKLQEKMVNVMTKFFETP